MTSSYRRISALWTKYS